MGNIEKVLIFGSTGRVGSCLLRLLVSEFQVSVLVRTPSKVPETVKSKVNIIQGDVTNAEEVEKAVEGHDAVIYTIGPPRRLFARSTTTSDGTRFVLKAMEKHSAQKLIVLNIPHRWQQGTFNHTLLKTLTPYGDQGTQMEVLKADKSISWVAIGTPTIKYEDTVNPTYMVDLEKDPGVNEATTGELADFMLKILKSDEEFAKYHRGLVGISSRPKTKWF